MSLQSVRQFFAERAPDIEIIELTQSTATVALAAAAHNVEPGQIAKTLSLKIKERVVTIFQIPSIKKEPDYINKPALKQICLNYSSSR